MSDKDAYAYILGCSISADQDRVRLSWPHPITAMYLTPEQARFMADSLIAAVGASDRKRKAEWPNVRIKPC